MKKTLAVMCIALALIFGFNGGATARAIDPPYGGQF